MRNLFGTITLLAICSPAFAQLDSGSLTVAVTRSITLQPDQAVITVSVLSGLDGSLEEILGTVADAGITEADFAGVVSFNRQTGATLRWDFNLAVLLAQLPDTISSLRRLGLTYALRGATVSPEKAASAQCPRADLIAGATAQAHKMALAAAVTLGPILSMTEGGPVAGGIGGAFVFSAAFRLGDFSGTLIGTPPLPALPPVLPVVCTIAVKFGLGR